METQIQTLLKTIKNDYFDHTLRGRSETELSEINRTMIQEFNDNITINEGQKYIKIITGNGGGQRVWGFVVNTNTDKKFQRGDILKAASWAAPARNKPRGNILKDDFSWVRWTGPEYLK